MKRTLQLLGEMRNYQLPQAKRAVEEMAADEELVIILPEQSLAEAIQQWATGQGYTASNPKKSGEGIIRWQVSVQKAASSGAKAPAGAPTVPS
jgi:TusA-related sulfurtransferase